MDSTSFKISVLKRILRDVARGFSLAHYKGKRIYVKHLGVVDQVDIDDYREEHYVRAKERGIPTEKETLELLIETGEWSEEQEQAIDRAEKYITQLIENKSGMYLQSQLDSQEKAIEDERKALVEKVAIRRSLLGNTCEEYADKRCVDLYVMRSFFKDREFKKRVFTQESFDDLSHAGLSIVTSIYDKIFGTFTEENFQKLVIEDFYSTYLHACEKPIDFFGMPTLELTHYQLRLYSYTILFKGIFTSGEEIPFRIRKNPQKILDWARNPKGREKAREVMEKSADGGAGLFGATKEDLDTLGVETSGPGTVSLEEVAKKKGGSLTMKDLMELSGL
tara:strand:+ start:2208 stop:3212 length:1005 start_codon:yes stop_codon:yes gene_type:complete